MEALSQLALGSNPNAWQELVKPSKNAQPGAVKLWLRSQDGDDMAALKEALIESYDMQRLTKISQRRGGGLSEAEDDDRPIQPLRSQRADQRRRGRGSQRRGDGLNDSEDDEQPARSQRAPERRRGRDAAVMLRPSSSSTRRAVPLATQSRAISRSSSKMPRPDHRRGVAI